MMRRATLLLLLCQLLLLCKAWAAWPPSGQEEEDEHFYTDACLTVSYLYPNPANEQVTLRYEVQRQVQANIQIRDILGVEITSYRLPMGASPNELRIPTLHYKAGIYYCTLNVEGKNVASQRFMVRR